MSMHRLHALSGFCSFCSASSGYVGTGARERHGADSGVRRGAVPVLALVARNPEARKHVMHAAVALALLGGSRRRAAHRRRPSTPASSAVRRCWRRSPWRTILLVYVLLGVKSFIDARRARR